MFKYIWPKGRNRIAGAQRLLRSLGTHVLPDGRYDVRQPHLIEQEIEDRLATLLTRYEDIIVDVTAMTKLLSLVLLVKLQRYEGRVRVVYSEAAHYAPSNAQYRKALKNNIRAHAAFPTKGFETIVRTRSLGSIRMQGKPVCLIAFTSFNEQLVRHVLGTISPHRLVFINGKPPLVAMEWRERATQEIHRKLLDEYPQDNPVNRRGRLLRTTSTLDYVETVSVLAHLYSEFSRHERIIVLATGSKMQTLGLALAKLRHPDLHIEYPTPDSYYFPGLTRGVRRVHEVLFASFSDQVAPAHGGQEVFEAWARLTSAS